MPALNANGRLNVNAHAHALDLEGAAHSATRALTVTATATAIAPVAAASPSASSTASSSGSASPAHSSGPSSPIAAHPMPIPSQDSMNDAALVPPPAGETFKPRDRLDTICEYLRSRTSIRPLVGIICGSGLGGLSQCLDRTETIKYEDIPQFPRSTVEGHAGELVFGWIDTYPVVCMRGRFHSYEGYDIRETTLPIRVMSLLGIQYLIVTNAAGGLNPEYKVGDIMVMNDHLNMPGMAGKHPLVGPNDARFGARFTPLLGCYDKQLQAIAYETSERLQLCHRVRRRGVYCFVSGPTYETPTECRFLRLVGCDAVGMSTVPEVIVAVHSGIKVLGLSLITNKSIFPGEEGVPPSHEEVLQATKAAASIIERFVEEMVREIGQQHRRPSDLRN